MPQVGSLGQQGCCSPWLFSCLSRFLAEKRGVQIALAVLEKYGWSQLKSDLTTLELTKGDLQATSFSALRIIHAFT